MNKPFLYLYTESKQNESKYFFFKLSMDIFILKKHTTLTRMLDGNVDI